MQRAFSAAEIDFLEQNCVQALEPSLRTLWCHWLYSRKKCYRLSLVFIWFIQVCSLYCRYLLVFYLVICPALTGNTHHKRWRVPKSVNSPKWMLQVRTAQYTFRTSRVLDWRFRSKCGNFYFTSWSLNMISHHLFSVCFWNLDSHVYLRSINNVRTYPQQLFCIKSGKHIGHPHNHELINGPQALSRVLLCTQRASFYDTNKWELLW